MSKKRNTVAFTRNTRNKKQAFSAFPVRRKWERNVSLFSHSGILLFRVCESGHLLPKREQRALPELGICAFVT